MPIFYSIAASKGGDGEEDEIIAEYPTTEKAFAETCRSIVAQTKLANQRQVYEQDRHRYHIKVSGRNVYICVADSDFPMRICSAFLESVASAIENGEKKPRVMMRDKMNFHNDTKNDKVFKVQAQIDEVKDIMIDNIDKVIQRGDNLNTIADKAQNLENTAVHFHRTAVKVKRNMCAQNIQLIIIITALILGITAVALIVIIVSVCKTVGCN